MADAYAVIPVGPTPGAPTWRKFQETPGRLSEKLTSDVAQEARELYDEIAQRETQLRSIEAERHEIDSRLATAEQRLQAAIEQDVAEIGDGSAIQTARADFEAVKTAATSDLEVWRARVEAAREAIPVAESKLRRLIDENALKLAEELLPHAHKTHKEWQAADEEERKIREKVKAPIEQAHRDITETLESLLGRTHPFTRSDIAIEQYDQLPYVSNDALAAYHAQQIADEDAPEPERVVHPAEV